MITYTEAKYLKAAGAQMDVKVTIKQKGYLRPIYIRDREMFSFNDALTCLQHIAENEMVSDREEVVS